MSKINSFYLNSINRIKLMTQEEEREVAEKANKGDKSAQKKLVEANLRFVVKIANQYKSYMDVEDLINEGNMGLMHAAEKFDPSTGYRFNTYAVWWIRSYMQKAIRETSTGVKFPANKYEDMKLDKWKFASLEKSFEGSEEETACLGNLISDEKVIDPEEDYCRKETEEIFRNSMKSLRGNEKEVLIKRYGLDGKEPMSLSKIGTLMGYSKERIRQIEKKALSELKKKISYMEEYGTMVS